MWLKIISENCYQPSDNNPMCFSILGLEINDAMFVTMQKKHIWDNQFICIVD